MKGGGKLERLYPGKWGKPETTTKPPDNSQAEVAIHALNGAMSLEEKQGGELVIA